MRILIIEDEVIAAEDLIRCIREIKPSAIITKVLSSIQESVGYLSEKQDFDIIFTDIQLGDGTCFEIFRKINIKVPIIFCTAYDNFLMEAFKTNGIDYILKPFDTKTIEKALKKFELLTKFEDNNVNELIDYVESERSEYQKNTIVIHQKDRIISIPMNSIALSYLKNGIANIIGFDESENLAYKTLEELENMLSDDFFRANRQYILNRLAIKEVVRIYNRRIKVKLNIPFPEDIIISKEKARQFLDWLSNK